PGPDRGAGPYPPRAAGPRGAAGSAFPGGPPAPRMPRGGGRRALTGDGGYPEPGGEPGFRLSGETAALPVTGARPPSWSDEGLYADDAYSDDTYYDDNYDDEGFDDEADELPRRKGCRNALIVLAVLVVMAVVAGWFGWSWVQGKIDPAGDPGEVVIVEIPEGTSTSAVGRILADSGVISDASVWNWYTKVRDVGTIQAGKYEMRENSSFTEAIDDLAEEPFPPESELVTVPEGLTQAQIAERLADPENGVEGFTAERVQAALADKASRSAVLPADQPLLEGTLFPETYAVEEGDTEAVVIQRMVAQFDEVATAVDLQGRAEALGYSPYEVLIVASMVEREAGTVEDGPKVARVIYNRLAAGEALGIDATSCYEKGEIPCKLTTAELEDNTPYDTRYRQGLPPTPIASPGRASIEAALAPAEGDWKWYVLDAERNDGSSLFTDDYDEFQAAKQACIDAGLGCG
ncbi:MAG TPA: endolytic transglycosylase MltG, partial [Acidimicrobiales bacterium]